MKTFPTMGHKIGDDDNLVQQVFDLDSHDAPLPDGWMRQIPHGYHPHDVENEKDIPVMEMPRRGPGRPRKES